MRPEDPARASSSETEASVTDHLVAPTASIPERIGPYRVQALLGRGGMGEVYLAWDPRLERRVAVKRIRSADAQPRARARFWREARVLAAVKHDNLVALHDIGEEGGQLYLAMEHVEGQSLAEARSARWPLAEAVELVRQVARAVGAAHRCDIVHRDIKPSNVLIDRSGRPRLIDFGLARRLDEDEVTQVGAVVGTWSWMAPEQIVGDTLRPATDVHALGAILYALLMGHSPYQRESKEATAAAILSGTRVELRSTRPDVPLPLEQIIRMSLSRDPAQRPADGEIMADQLGRWLESEGFAPDNRALRMAFESARAAIRDPGLSTGVVSGTTARRPPRSLRVWWVGVAAVLVALLTTAWVFLPGDSKGSVVSVDEFVPVLRRADLDVARFAREALAKRPRKVLAVLPLKTVDGAPHRLGGIAAELLRNDLAEVPEFVVVPWRALLARSDDPPESLSVANWSGDALAQVDVVLDGVMVERAGELDVQLSLRQVGTGLELASLEVETPSTSLIPAMRSLARPLASELGASVDLAELPRGGTSPRGSEKAIGLLLEAERALHHEHWRKFRRLISEALAADPELPRARLLQALISSISEKADRARQILTELLEADIPERDRSVAKTLLSRYSGDTARTTDLLLQHLQRFPADLEVKLDLLRERFRSMGTSKLSNAVAYAEEILGETPRATQAASKLARALTWTEGLNSARTRLAAHGIDRVPGASKVTDFVMAELDLYSGHFEEAVRAFEAVRETDGDPTYFAAHMRIAALMLGGHCDEAHDASIFEMRAASSQEGALGVDWTYLFALHSLLCSGRLGEAHEMASDWARRLGPTAGAVIYRSMVSSIEVLLDPDPARVANRSLASVPTASLIEWPDHISLMFADDGDGLRSLLSELRWEQRRIADMFGVDMRQRMMRGMEARARFLEGDVDTALDQFRDLAFPEGPALREGDLYERTRWLGVYAHHLYAAGQHELAREMWQGLLSIGFGRVLAMEMTWLARVGLGTAEANHGLR